MECSGEAVRVITTPPTSSYAARLRTKNKQCSHANRQSPPVVNIFFRATSCEARASHILKTMRFFIFVCAFFCVSASADFGEEPKVLHKCCPENQSLVKVSDSEQSESVYECITPASAVEKYAVHTSPFVVGDNVFVEYGLPEQCDSLQMIQVTSAELDTRLKSINDDCYDRLVIEVVNATLKSNIPKIVNLICVRNGTEIKNEPRTKFIVNQFRKCCPNGQSYDSQYHLCRDALNDSNTEKWLLKRLTASNDRIYEVEIRLDCKRDEYAVELTEDFFSVVLEGSNLRVQKRDDNKDSEVPPGEWCLDRNYHKQGLVARVCTRDCSKYGAFCMKKCCPVGQHFRPSRCNSFVSKCVPNDDDILFDLADYLNPVEHDYPHVTDIQGIGLGLLCDAGRVALNKSFEPDRHRLLPDARLVSSISTGHNYCFESFDRRNCPQHHDIIVTALNCFIKAPITKDFRMSFVFIIISSVCLALTLVVYLSMPELRNLHGRTLICHVSMMLLAFCCLARVQYSKVDDVGICTLLGYGIYFGFVAAFAWLNVMCFDIWWTFGSVRTVQPMRKASSELRRFMWYSVYAWSFAVMLTLIMFLFDQYPVARYLDANIGVGMCWFGTLQNSQWDWPHYIFFVVPMGLISCTNFVLWVLTARHCAHVKSEVHRLQAGSVGDRVKRRFRVDRAKYVLTGKLWVVMGAGWISELLSTLATEPLWLWSIIDLINTLQGVFIFLILVMKPKLYYLVRKRLGLEKPDAAKNGASSSGRTSSTFLSRTISSDERALTRLSIQNNVKHS